MSKMLKAGIIGCGGIAEGKHMPALSKNKNVVMTAFCDIIKERAEKAAERFGEPGSKVFEDYHELIALPEIDVVYVLTPNREHSFITVDALNAGKHVMCEKPMAKTSAEAALMVETAKKTGRKLSIGYQGRFSKPAIYLKKMCEKGELGEIYYAKSFAIRRRAVPTWGVFLDREAQGGGPLIDIGTHALDLTLWMMNNYKPKMVNGTVFHKLGKQTETANAWGDWNPDTFDVEDSAVGFIKMENGATIFLESSWALNTTEVRESSASLCGDKAGALIQGGKTLEINFVKNNTQVVETPNFSAGGVAFYDGADGDSPAECECASFINAILNDSQPVVLPEQAFVVTQILEAIYESAKTGQPVRF